MAKGIFCSIDTPDLRQAEKLAREIAPVTGHIKLGLEFFTANGPEGFATVRAAAGESAKIFLDLKFHDIPNTVAGAVRSAVQCRADFLTIHTAGGPEMIRAALDAAAEESRKTGIPAPLILGVTVLTSMDDAALTSVGQSTPAAEQVLRLAKTGYAAGLRGFVCSPQEIALLKKNMQDIILVVPGIRPATAEKGDQKRVMTPEQAAAAGADYLVIGRPITGAADPAQGARDIMRSLST